MAAIGLSLALFILWLGIGYPIVAWSSRAGRLQNLLVAPVVGLSVLVISVFTLNRAGLPVAHFGVWLGLGLVATSAVAWWWIRPVVPIRQYWPFAAVLLAALLLVGWPAVQFGFDWLSYSNDDMGNYTAGATFLLHRGFWDAPSLADLASRTDYSLTRWDDLHAARPGASYLLAWIGTVTGLTHYEVYMPVMLACHLAVVSATGALVLHGARRWRAALLTCLLLALSATMALGTLYQLLPQVGGSALLAGSMTLGARLFRERHWPGAVRRGLVAGLVVSAFPMVYPELTPFLALGGGLNVAVLFFRRSLRVRTFLVGVGSAALLGIVLLATYLPQYVPLMFTMTRIGTTAPQQADEALLALHPYYLRPSGLANLWGFQSITGLSGEPWLSASILLGAILLVLATLLAVRLAWEGNPAACVALVMLEFAGLLFARRSDFGIWKVAMYIQPFLLASLVTGCLASAGRIVRFDLPRWSGLSSGTPWGVQLPGSRSVVGLLLAVGSLSLIAQADYTRRSRADFGGGLVEIPHASDGIAREFRDLLTSASPEELVLNTPNQVLANIQTMFARGVSTSVSAFGGSRIVGGATVVGGDPRAAFDLHPQADGEPAQNRFSTDPHEPPDIPAEHTTLISVTGRQNIFNRWHWPESREGNFVAERWTEAHDRLMLIPSDLGKQYYGIRGDEPVAMWQLEPDVMLPGRSMSGIGRRLLFQVVNPSSPVRLVLEYTASLQGSGHDGLGQPSAIGRERVPLAVAGRGSARLFSPPITPQVIEGRSFLAIDVGKAPERFPQRLTGLMNLFGTDVVADKRFLVGFGRDISLISEEDYEQLDAPSVVANFPGDLTNKNLEYSGIYEDGWISEHSWFNLSEPPGQAAIVLRGTVPMISDPAFETELTVLVDGVPAAVQKLAIGDFALQVLPAPGPGRRKVELQFSNLQSLPAPDDRPVAARLRFVGFAPEVARASAVSEATDIILDGEGLSLGQGWASLETYGEERFRWVGDGAELAVAQPGNDSAAVRVEVEPGPGLGLQPFLIELRDASGQEIANAWVSGRQEVILQLVRAAGGETYRLQANGGNAPAVGGPRPLNFRVFNISWADSAPSPRPG